MPYIKYGNRPQLDKYINPLIGIIRDSPLEEQDGKLNYIISSLLRQYKPRYFNYNRAIGVLECVKFELYRRIVAPYEDQKIAENGDLQ